MCRSIKVLRNGTTPPVSEEVRAASLQFVRKISGFNKPSKVNEAAWSRALETITAAASELLESVAVNAPAATRAHSAPTDKAVQ